MIKTVKQGVLRAASQFGMLSVFRDSRWRGRRLLILGYHGVALEDEHEWNAGIYLSRAAFEERLNILARGEYNVLALDSALRMLREGTLPERAVVLTFDDGHYDFLVHARPLLKQFGYPATVYLTTYYCDFNVPVFDLICSYVLWKARNRAAFELAFGRGQILIDGSGRDAAAATLQRIHAFAQRAGLSGRDKDELARAIAAGLGLDYEHFRRTRFLHLMNPAEVAALASEGVDFQLHSHTHRLPLDEALFRGEIEANAQRVQALAQSTPLHFCYPSGRWNGRFFDWLEASGIESAVTCIPGMADAGSNRYLLPRIMDHGGLSGIEFEGWLSGAAALFPRTRLPDGQIRAGA